MTFYQTSVCGVDALQGGEAARLQAVKRMKASFQLPFATADTLHPQRALVFL